MGCGASNEAAALPVIPEAQRAGTASQRAPPPKAAATAPMSPPTGAPPPKAAPNTSPPGAARPSIVVMPSTASANTATVPASPNPNGAGGLSTVPAGLSSFRHTASIDSRRGSLSMADGFSDELPALKTTPRGKMAPNAALSAEPPAGSQIPGLNYCNAEFFPTHMEQVWNHYARAPDYKVIDKSGLKLMGEDCVNSYCEAAKRFLQKENPRWDEKKLEAKIAGLRQQFLPGTKIEDSILIATHYLAHELKYASSEDSKSSGVSKPCFFLHFQRAHRLLFSFTGAASITLERELTVQRLNKQGVERANKGLKSLTAKAASGNNAKQESSIVSSRGTKSAKSARHKSGKRASGATASMKPAKGQNMFDVDGAFDQPPAASAATQ